MTGRLRGAAAALVVALCCPAPAVAQTTRLVVIKADGLRFDIVDRMVRERNPRTGQSVLPWLERVFYEGGTRLSNFYVRGLSLSGPAWSMLDTGQHLRIKANVEFDRYIEYGYDYLNFLPFWLANARGRAGDMWGAAVLDEIGIPLLIDAYGHDERYQSAQLYQRGSRWMTLGEGVQKRFTTRTPRELVDEWFVGFDTRDILTEQQEREVITGLANPRIRYLDYYTTEFDHATHHNRDDASHRFALQDLDGVIGRIWTAISRTPEAAETALVLVSDHGVNTDARVYSQGYNLVSLLASAAGGGHHVVTKRRLMKDYSIKGIYPLVPLITTASHESLYLKGREDDYPTALLDFDGNERAAIHVRDSTFNLLHALLVELQKRKLPVEVRRAAADAFLAVVDRQRSEWQQMVREMREELAAVGRARDALRAELPPPPDRKARNAPPETGEARDERLRLTARVEDWTKEVVDYGAFLGTLERLLAVTPATLATPSSFRIEQLIPKHSMGDRNTLHELTNYVMGVAPGGLVLAPDGSLDIGKSFARVDYVALLNGVKVRNNVQAGVGPAPVDFTVVSVPCGSVADIDVRGADSCIWLSSSPDSQALVLARTDPDRGLMLRYLPISRLTAGPDGVISATAVDWRPGLPLRLLEDEGIDLPAGDARRAWLESWHTEAEWLRATHRGLYSHAVVAIHEQFASHEPAPPVASGGEALSDEQLIRRLRLRQRRVVEPDLNVLAGNHWNFDVRGFNPGGNHGSFFRVSAHATLMFAGGDRTGIPRGLNVEDPYDTLSFVPTVMALTGQVDRAGQPSQVLRERGFSSFPGRVITEVLVPSAGEGAAVRRAP